MISENIRNIRDRVAGACARRGRNPQDVVLLAVAKTFPGSLISEAVEAGVADIGENYVQEMLRKQEIVKDPRVRWHFIGHLQRNKVRSLIGRVGLIHSVDSFQLGQEISARASDAGIVATVLVQVNTTGERTKFGTAVKDARGLTERLLALPRLAVAGFMTIGPMLPDPEQSRPAFRELAGLQDSCRRDGIFLPHLSMGMTNDFEIAVEEGATLIRVGTAIFGARTPAVPVGLQNRRD